MADKRNLELSDEELEKAAGGTVQIEKKIEISAKNEIEGKYGETGERDIADKLDVALKKDVLGIARDVTKDVNNIVVAKKAKSLSEKKGASEK